MKNSLADGSGTSSGFTTVQQGYFKEEMDKMAAKLATVCQYLLSNEICAIDWLIDWSVDFRVVTW